ncbi:hypothetical protein L218DRAFT_934964 [Marasmius fiardii PR-910]|nr:hypothetical protein L218DRAFT_934964 [Marasmius fiardii PR-910]
MNRSNTALFSSTSSSSNISPGAVAHTTRPTASPILSGSSQTDSTPSHSSFPSSEYQPATRFLACFRCRGRKAKCDDAQPCTACARSNVECMRPTGRRKKRTRSDFDRTAAEGIEYYGRVYDYDTSTYRDDRRLENPPKHMRPAVYVDSSTYQEANYNSSGSMPTSASNHQYIQIPTDSRSAFFPPTLPEPYATQTTPLSHAHPERQHILRSASSMVPYPQIPSMYNGQLPYNQHAPTTNNFSDNADSSAASIADHPLHHNQIRTHTTPSQEDFGAAVHSLRKQVGFLEGNPGESQTLKVHYYRLTGCTAIHPGFNRIAITLRSSPKSPIDSSPRSLSSGHGTPPSLEEDISMNPSPLDDIMLTTFFTYFGEHCPFLRRTKVEERIRAGTMSAFLGFSMCAIAVRYIPNAKTKPSQFIDAAWKLMLPLLRLPSADVVAGLLMLSWAEFGENSESGLWNFLGLAIRMAQDLGLHKCDDPDVIPIDDVCNGRVLFWSLFISDRILAFGTGRPVTIPSESIEISPLNEIDLAGVASPPSNLNPGSPELPSPYIYVVKLFDLAGHIANCMNRSTSPMKISVGTDCLQSLHDQFLSFIDELPECLAWSVDNFRAQAAWNRGASFLFLHLWANAILALIHRPDLGRQEGPSDTGFENSTTTSSPGIKRSTDLSLVLSRQIVDCMIIADLFDERSFCTCPFINQCLFIAGVAFVDSMKLIPEGVPTTVDPEGSSRLQTWSPNSEFLYGLTKQNLSILFRALKKMERYWSGMGYVISILEQQASGRGWSKVDSSIISSSRFISLPDMGLLRKLTGNRDEEGRSCGMTLSYPVLIRSHNPEGQHQQSSNGDPAAVSLSQALQEPRPQYGPSWSFDSLLGSYKVHEVTASGLDFSSVYPGGLTW